MPQDGTIIRTDFNDGVKRRCVFMNTITKHVCLSHEKTLGELEKELGADKKVRLIGEDENLAVFIYNKHQVSLSDQDYSFDVGV